MRIPIRELADKLRSGKVTSAALIENCLAAADSSESVFITLNADEARREALQIDRMRRDGDPLPYYAGIPLTLKDLFDVRGEVTAAGSRVLAFDLPAEKDAVVIERLRQAGFIFLGRVNMSEFAFSGMGTNPHYGTPLCVWDRKSKRLPGGSSSGSGVSVAEGIVSGSIGSDTAGSTRIPAAFNGVVGYKPSFGRLPLDGIYPLSPTTDAPGPLANTVDCCFLLDAVMDGAMRPPGALTGLGRPPKLLLPQAEVMEELDMVVRQTFERAIDHLVASGCIVKSMPVEQLDRLLGLFQTTPLATYEAWQAHRQRIKSSGEEYDPFVSWRISSGADISAKEYRATLSERRLLIGEFNDLVSDFDALVYPTVSCLPPKLAEVDNLNSARPVNFRCLRNTATVNYFDGCAISLPCHRGEDAPVGLMLSGCHKQDYQLFQVASDVERVLRPLRL